MQWIEIDRKTLVHNLHQFQKLIGRGCTYRATRATRLAPNGSLPSHFPQRS